MRVETIEQEVKEPNEEIDEESQFLDSLYYDVVRARSYSLLLENIAKHNKHDITSDISFYALIESLITTVFRMYDYNSKIGCIQKQVDRIESIFKGFDKDNYHETKVIKKLHSLVGENEKRLNDDFSRIKEWRNKCIAHKDKDYENKLIALRKSKILNLVEPYISFAENIYDYFSTNNRKVIINNVKKRINNECN